MQEVVRIGNNDLQVKMWNGQRVVTFKDIDHVHERPDGTASRNFRENREYFILDEDYFVVTGQKLKELKQTTNFVGSNAKEIIFITEMGYLMIAKSLTDSLAWKVQRQLVNTYFKFSQIVQDFNSSYPIDTNALNAFLSEMKKNLPCIYAQINNIESTLEDVVDNMTLSTRQQEKIHEAARKRVNHLLGGAHSIVYKQKARSYMINLWNGLKAAFHCGSSYKDLNPKDFENAIEFIKHWIYEE